MNGKIKIKVLVDNKVSDHKLLAEHGLSFWIEYEGNKILFDAGQSDIIFNNAEKTGVDLKDSDAVVISHGHYDHTGGLGRLLEGDFGSRVYLHSKAFEEKYSCKNDNLRYIGIRPEIKDELKQLKEKDQIVFTDKGLEIFEGVNVSGAIERRNDFEDVGGKFCLDEDMQKADPIVDDQCLYIEKEEGVVVILGCAHSGVINTLEQISRKTEGKKLLAVIGGMHLVNADENRISKTIENLKRFDPDILIPCHCTGDEASRIIWRNFEDRYLDCGSGREIEIY